MITTEQGTKVPSMGGTISTDKALALDISALPTDQEEFMAVGVVMAVGFASNGDTTRSTARL